MAPTCYTTLPSTTQPSTTQAAATYRSIPRAFPAFALRTLIAALTLLVAVPATYAESASTSANPTCWQVSRETLAQYSSVTGNTATLVVPSWACPVEVSFSTYSLPGGEILPYEEQVLYDNVTDTYGPGTYHLTLDAPDCAYQSDLYLGEVISPLTAGAHHNHNGTNYLIKYDLRNEGQTCDTPPPPPPGETCDAAEDGCMKAELIGVTTNDDGTQTYNVRITYNCHKGLSYAALQLPEGAEAVSYSTGWPIVNVENPGGTRGWHNPRFRNTKFEFGGDIKNGESVELSYTLPAGSELEDGLRVQTKGGWYTQKVTLDPSGCVPPPPPPPPPGEVCDAAEDGCLQVELLEVVTNDDGTVTYNVRITYNCHKGLDKAYLELPEGVEAVSYSTGWPIVDVDNPGDRGGWYNPDYNNVEFTFGRGIDNGDSVELSYTLPAGTGYTDGLRVRTWGGWYKQKVTLDPSECAPPPPPPPPSEVCDMAEDGCMKAELIGVTTNDDGTQTYNVRITYNCHKGLSYAALQLPEGAEAVSYSTGWPIVNVENPGGTRGWHNPRFRNTKFEFGGDIKNGESVELSYTLPAGSELEDGLRVQTKGGWYTQKVTLDPSACTDPCVLDAGPPEVAFAMTSEGGEQYLDVTVTDDTGLGTITYEATDNFAVEGTPFAFDPGDLEATARFRLISLDPSLLNEVRVRATDLCDRAACDDEMAPVFANRFFVLVDDETGDVIPFESPVPEAFDRIGLQIEVEEDVELGYYQLFNIQNFRFNAQPDESCADPFAGCPVSIAGPATSTFIIEEVVPNTGGRYGLLVADACNASVLDPEVQGGDLGRGAVAGAGGGLHVPAGMLGARDEATTLPTEFAVSPNYPNPFRGSTSITVDLPAPTELRIEVYNVLGQRVRVLAEGTYEAGRESFRFEASGLASGTYIYRVVTPERTAVHRMTVAN